MNYVLGRLLLFFEPEPAFWALDCICFGYHPFTLPAKWENWELYQSEYYKEGMRLVRSDAQVVHELLVKYNICAKEAFRSELDVAFLAPW